MMLLLHSEVTGSIPMLSRKTCRGVSVVIVVINVQKLCVRDVGFIDQAMLSSVNAVYRQYGITTLQTFLVPGRANGTVLQDIVLS